MSPIPDRKSHIKTVIGDITDTSLFQNNDIICHQVNCSMRYSHGLSRTLEIAYPYGSIFQSKTENKKNVLPDNLLRKPGSCILGSEKTNNFPLIANLTSHFYFGKAADEGGFQSGYLKKFTGFYGQQFEDYMTKDTTTQRLIWFEECLKHLASQLEDKTSPLNLYFPDNRNDLTGKYIDAIKNFLKDLSKPNISVFIVKDPLSCSAKDYERYDVLGTTHMSSGSMHTPGLYRNVPNSFCKDPACTGCKSNQLILKLFAEDIETDSDRPVDNIDNGMIPQIPVINNESERSQVFSKLLEDMDVTCLTTEQAKQMKYMLSQYSSLFLLSDNDEHGLIKDFEANIETKGEPISCKPRRFGEKAIKIMEKLNDIMQKKGLTKPCDGPWASPVVLVKKKTLPGTQQDPNSPSSYRFCIDYRKINQKSVVWKAYPTGDLRTMLHKAAGYAFNTTIDVTNAFFAVKIRETDQQKTAFQLPSGLWAFTRLPQGLKISPQIWAKAADKILKPVQDIASWYVDDIFCGSDTFEKHMSDVDRVLHQLQQSGLKIRFEKCLFFRHKVNWLGHVLSKDGVQPNPQGVQAIKNLQPPKNVKELRSILGSLVYFKDFIDKFSDLTTPLTTLLQKHQKFIWKPDHQKALDALKDALASDKILIKPDFNKDFYLQTDASDVAVSAILSQKDENNLLRPIQYWSKKLNGPELNYYPTEKEAFAIYLAFKKFETYLLLNTTHVITDAAVLKAFYGSKDITSKRILRWSLYVGQFNHTVTHISGPDNVLADMVSRCVQYPNDAMYSIMTNQSPVQLGELSIENIIIHQKKDPLCKALFNYCKTHLLDPPIHDWPLDTLECYKISQEGLLTFVPLTTTNPETIEIPQSLVPVVLYNNHDTLFSNHQGVDRTYEKLQRKYHWNNIRKDTSDYVLSCDKCQRFKTTASPYFTNYVGSMKITADQPNEILFVDIAYVQSSPEGYLYFLLVVDSFSRLIEAFPLRTMTAQEIIKELTRYCCIHGFPNQIFSDAAGDFKKAMVNDCSHLLNVNHKTSIPWRHQSNISERYIQMVKTGIRLMVPENRLGWWPRYIKFVVYALNTSYCRSLNMSPFEAYFSRQPLEQPSVGHLNLPDTYISNQDNWIQELRRQIKENSASMTTQYRQNVNKTINKPCATVVVGQLVMMRKHSFTPGVSKKLQAIREGPLRVIGVQGSKIDLEFVNNESQKRERHISDLAKYYSRPKHLIKAIDSSPATIEVSSTLEPTTITGDLWTVDRGVTSLLVLEWDSLSLVANSSLTNNLNTAYTYFNRTGGSVPHPDDKRFAKSPRKPGITHFYQHRTRHAQGPSIAAMVTKILLGPSAEYLDLQTISIPSSHQSLLTTDTLANRDIWLAEALKQIHEWINNKDDPPGITSVYFTASIFQDDSSNKLLKTFTWWMNSMGIKVFVLKSIEVNDS